MIVIANSYPKADAVPSAEVGDIVHWEHAKTFRLIRDADGKTMFSTALVDRDGMLRSNGKQPVLVGIIAQVKNKGWKFEIKKEE